jgi:hypothetical protein
MVKSMARKAPNAPNPIGIRRPSLVTVLLFVAAAAGAVATAAISLPAFLTVLIDGATAAAIFLAGCGLGLLSIRLLGLSDREPDFQLISGAVVGTGLLGLGVLGAAAVGLLAGWFWWGGIALLGAIGIVQARALIGDSKAESSKIPEDWSRLIWMLVVPFGVILALTATLPVGTLWKDEAYGYDALEYHLQVPREWYEAGRLTYLPHNAYSNMPLLMETLYLLCMILRGGPYEAIYAAQLVHAGMAILSVGGVYLICRPVSLWAARTAAVVAATCPWLAYLGCLPYNEWGLGACLAVGLAALSDAVLRPERRSLGLAALSGIALGLCGGCKYTGLVMGAVPVIAAWLVASWRKKRRLPDPLVAAGAALLVFSPWMVKNVVYTGNPIFPLGYEVLGGRGWTDELATRWDRGHSPLPHQSSASARGKEFVKQVVASRYFGPVTSLWAGLAFAALWWRRSGLEAILWVVAAAQILIWVLTTHLLGRFAVPLVVPLAALAGLTAHTAPRWSRIAFIGLLVAGGFYNLHWLAGLYWQEGRVQPLANHGAAGVVLANSWPTNRVIPADAKVLMVGTAMPFYILRDLDYNVVFSPNPLAEVMASSRDPADVVRWLQDNGYTHVLVHWAEVSRLRQTYGYEPEITRDNFKKLEPVGLTLIREAADEENSMGDRTLYATPLVRNTGE